jgi:hypothetical protein
MRRAPRLGVAKSEVPRARHHLLEQGPVTSARWPGQRLNPARLLESAYSGGIDKRSTLRSTYPAVFPRFLPMTIEQLLRALRQPLALLDAFLKPRLRLLNLRKEVATFAGHFTNPAWNHSEDGNGDMPGLFPANGRGSASRPGCGTGRVSSPAKSAAPLRRRTSPSRPPRATARAPANHRGSSSAG